MSGVGVIVLKDLGQPSEGGGTPEGCYVSATEIPSVDRPFPSSALWINRHYVGDSGDLWVHFHDVEGER